MEKYVSLVKKRLGNFSAWKLEHIPRDCNEKTDALAAIAAFLLMTRNCVPAHLLSVGFFNYHYPSKLGGRGLPFLDVPHSIIYQHGRTPK